MADPDDIKAIAKYIELEHGAAPDTGSERHIQSQYAAVVTLLVPPVAGGQAKWTALP